MRLSIVALLAAAFAPVRTGIVVQTPSIRLTSGHLIEGRFERQASGMYHYRADGGVLYYYSDSEVGLRDPAYIHAHGGWPYYGERISFTLLATSDCSFLLRHVDAEGNVRQLSPNRYAQNSNRLKASKPMTIPSADLYYEFAAASPPGIETVRLIVTRAADVIQYDDQKTMNVDEIVEAEMRMRRHDGNLSVQSRETAWQIADVDRHFLITTDLAMRLS